MDNLKVGRMQTKKKLRMLVVNGQLFSHPLRLAIGINLQSSIEKSIR